jgi:hypothetical protein
MSKNWLLLVLFSAHTGLVVGFAEPTTTSPRPGLFILEVQAGHWPTVNLIGMCSDLYRISKWAFTGP